jgi:hypothetical protein
MGMELLYEWSIRVENSKGAMKAECLNEYKCRGVLRSPGRPTGSGDYSACHMV